MKALIDGNILLDVLQNREPHAAASVKVWKLCEAGLAEGFVSALTFANLVYVMRKELTPERICEIQKKLALIFRFADLTSADLAKAAGMKWDDYEDAVQAAAAERVHADCIVTRNIRDFRQSAVPALLPEMFLEKYQLIKP